MFKQIFLQQKERKARSLFSRRIRDVWRYGWGCICPQVSSLWWHVSEFLFFLRLNIILLYVYTTFCISIYSLMGTWIASTFWQLWIMLLLHMGVQILLQDPAFNSLGFVPTSGMAGSYNSIFNFLRNLCTVFHSGCPILQFHQQYARIPISSPPCQHLLFSEFFDSSHPHGCEVVVSLWVWFVYA